MVAGMTSVRAVEQTRTGIAALLVSNIGWGVLPLYWHALSGMNALSVLSYRLIATMVSMIVLLMVLRRYRTYHRAIASLWRGKKLFALELAATAAISINWLLYIYLVVNGQALQTSIAYLTTPLLNVALAGIVFREQLGRIEWSSIVIAAVGVGMFAAQSPTFPWMAIVLAASFSVYGLLKRYVPMDAAQATTFETESVIPLALLWLAFQPRLGMPSPLTWPVAVLVALSGLATAIPLVTFAYGVQHSHYLTVSFFQYLNPLIQFCVAVFLLHEPMRPQGYMAFAVIWAAIAVYSFGAVRAYWERLKPRAR